MIMRHRILSAALCAGLLSALAAGPASAAEVPEKVRQTINDATSVLTTFAAPGSKQIPPAVLHGALCIAALPNITKGAFIFGGEGGKGVMSCREKDGKWGPPLMISLASASVGFQIGVEQSNLVLVMFSRKTASDLVENGLKFGANASAAAGPYGAKAGAPMNPDASPIFVYATNEGLMASAALNGTSVKPADRDNQLLYDKGTVPADAVLIPEPGKAWPVPAAAQGFLATLDKVAGHKAPKAKK
jgi:lipid-binding SYLF domain-containing protein